MKRDRRVPIDKGPIDTSVPEYSERLQTYQLSTWKRLLNVQAPYQWNLRRLHPGTTLDLGCGIGRNLGSLGSGSVGVDHNESCVEATRRRGFDAFTPDGFLNSARAQPNSFDTLLVAHVLEHLTVDDARALLKEYIIFVRPAGTVILITPQEAGFRRDASHRTFMDFSELGSLSKAVGATVMRQFSYPFPRAVGKVFFYNEFVVVARTPE